MKLEPDKEQLARKLIRNGVNREQANGIAICASKRHYRSRREAKSHARLYREVYKHKQHPYRCPVCGDWHLTTKGKK